jgi:hypothetical protein
VSDSRGLYALSTLDFGDMYTNTVRTRTLTLKNTGNEKLEIYFSSDAVEAMVWFTVNNTDAPNTPTDETKEDVDDLAKQDTADDEPQRVEELILLANSAQRVTVSYKYVPKPRIGGATPGTPADKEHFAYSQEEDETSLSPTKFKLLFKCKTDRNSKSSTSLSCQV